MRYIFNIKFGLLLVRENEISLRKWSVGTVHLRTVKGHCLHVLSLHLTFTVQCIYEISRIH